MKVFKYKKLFLEFLSLEDLHRYITNTIPNILSTNNKEKDIAELFERKELFKTDFDKRIGQMFSSNILSKQYWLDRGYTNKQAQELVSIEQKARSPLCLEYWKHKGYDIEIAKSQISQIQKRNSDCSKGSSKSVHNDKSKSCFSIKYWVNKGYTIDEARNEVYKISQRGSTLAYWIKKLGTEAGIQKYNSIGKKKSRSGVNNGMYGKTPPKNAGRGFTGYYKNIYFRSMLEYHFIKMFQCYHIESCDVANSRFVVSYDNKTYRPDFFIPDLNIVFEIKSRYFAKHSDTIKKRRAFIEKFGDKYDYVVITDEYIKQDNRDVIADYHAGHLKISKNKLDRFFKRYKINESNIQKSR